MGVPPTQERGYDVHMMWNPIAALDRWLTRGMADYELRATAEQFALHWRFPYGGVLIQSAVCIWLMWPYIAPWWIGLWFALSALSWAARAYFLAPLKKGFDSLPNCRRVLSIITLSSMSIGMSWGSFVWVYFDAQDPVRILMAGAVVAGNVGAGGPILGTFLPSFYAMAVPASAPLLLHLLMSEQTELRVLALLTLVFLVISSSYLRATQRMFRDGVRLRHDNAVLIDRLEERKAAAESASKTKSLFLAGVSHDLKQPLRAIAMYLEVLGFAKRDECADVLTQVRPKLEKTLGEANGQISRLLELSRLESGALQLQLEWVDLSVLYTELRTLFEGQASAKQTRLVFARLQHKPQLRVWVDRRMLESVMTNFVSNALKHAEGGCVYVGTRLRAGYPVGQRLCIEVRDSGTGIEAHQIPLLFDAYRSFDDRRASESHGLGLAIAKAQATYLGCDIDVRSQPGRGSTFTLCGLCTA